MFLLGILGLIVFYQDLGWVPANGRIAVKVINHLGDEVMKVFRVGAA